MRITVSFGSYNHRRYGTPWIARVDSWPLGQAPGLSFGRFIGDHRNGGAGEVEIDAAAGDIVRWGQKDNRGNGTTSKWGIVREDGCIESCSPTEARGHFEMERAKIHPPATTPEPTATLPRSIKVLLDAAEALYANACDRGETEDDDGNECEDWKVLRLAIEEVKGERP